MTRLAPPAQQTRLLIRERVNHLLAEAIDYPLTLLIAPAGSGKTTTLASMVAGQPGPVAWCRLSASDDPLALMRHLAAAFRFCLPTLEKRIGPMIEQFLEPAKAYVPEMVIDPLVNELATTLEHETILVLDDYQEADARPELRDLIDHLIATQPKRLHLILATRYEPLLASLPVARARGEAHEISQTDLAFTPNEAHDLFLLYEQTPPENLASLVGLCRGWPLALQLLAADPSRQSRALEPSVVLHENGTLPPAAHAEPNQGASPALQLEAIFPLISEYLTRQVLDIQPPALQNFLLRTAGLRWFDQEICHVLPGLQNMPSPQIEVERRRLFLELLPHERMTYQPIFKRFLERLAQQRISDRKTLHLVAAGHYHDQGDYEGTMHHLLAVGENERAVAVLEQTATAWIKQGRAAALLDWIGQLPPHQRQQPGLLEAQATANRRLGNFELALNLYALAEESFQAQGNLDGQVRALRGRAGVYLDTVQPAPAVNLLKQALKLLPRERLVERVEIVRLQAENWANRGRADVALRLEHYAHRLAMAGAHAATTDPRAQERAEQASTPAPLLLSRLMLRTGRLNESLHQLEADLGLTSYAGMEQSSALLAHREPSLLLAFVYTLLGKDARALAAARRGLLEAQQSGSLLTEAIAYMRVGHAYQVIASLDPAAVNRHYQRALEIIEQVGVSRTRVEGYMGLALLYGHRGDLGSAEAVAQEALEIAEESGDEWIAALVWLALGGAGVAMGDERALEWLDHAQQRFGRGGDSYGQAVVALWLALWYLRSGKSPQVTQYVTRLLDLTKRHGYEGLLTAPTLFGPRDLAMLIPLLLHGRTLSDYAVFAQQLLRQAFPSVASDEMVDDYHPGYTLHIQMLGSFRVWRGIREIQTREWQREKARQLLQLLLTYRGQWLQREQVCTWLWPESDLDAAERQFKVTLNALNAALEPFRPPRTMPFFVRRQGLAYSFAPSYGCWIDVDEFELRTTSVAQSDVEFSLRNSQIAVQLYKGDYLAEALYDPWTLEERERLMARYLATATTLADRLVDKNEIQLALQLCERVIRRDRCYEEAYQVLMRAYVRSGSRSQALRTYARCTQALQDELGIDPLPETTDLYERVKRNEKL